MMPGLSIDHIVILGIIALVVVGPKELPLLLRKLGMWTAKLRGMAQEFRTGFDELARQAELDDLRREVDALRQTTNLRSVTNELTKPLGTLESYASAPSPRYDTPPPTMSPSTGDAAQSAAGGAPAPAEGAPTEAPSAASSASPPQSSQGDDSSPIEGERVRSAAP